MRSMWMSLNFAMGCSVCLRPGAGFEGKKEGKGGWMDGDCAPARRAVAVSAKWGVLRYMGMPLPLGARPSGCRPCRDWSGGQGGQPDAAGQQGATGERRDRGIGHGALERFAVPAASACDNAGA